MIDGAAWMSRNPVRDQTLENGSSKQKPRIESRCGKQRRRWEARIKRIKRTMLMNRVRQGQGD